MTTNFARFVIHYKDGSTYIEDRADKFAWDSASKENITALGIQFDPSPMMVDNPYYIPAKDRKPDVEYDKKHNKQQLHIRDPIDNMPVRATFPENTLKGSSKYKYGFFQFKEAIQRLIAGRPADRVGLIVGMVINKQGDCICMRGKPDRSIYTFFTTVKSLTLNLELFGINLEELPDRDK